ncbi:MAG: PINc/VapC family ATPase [Candidatus Altiarchaeota archaeon]|nr:PINc/VapC family ATPase [Candidatus Altiarchaeota archaeon]
MAKPIVPDTSVIIDGRITELIRENKEQLEILLPQAIIRELEAQANEGREIGFEGLRELKALRDLAAGGKIRLSYKEAGRPAKTADEEIRNIAEDNGAVLVTSDFVQHLVADSKGLDVRYLEPKTRKTEPSAFKLLDETTMSVHLKENTPAYAKKGHIGRFELVKIINHVDRKTIEGYAKEIIEYAKSDVRGYIESQQKGATVIQQDKYRIVLTRPPFSDGIEITIVKPLVKTRLEDYRLSEKLLKRLESHAEGIFVAGSPGAGKSTFVQALAEHYRQKGKVVKTMEQPRDLQVSDEITQYAPLEGSMEKTADILLLVRPDYTLFDELRKTSDFTVFADMRLAGVGLVGVTHASKAIDAIQRLVGRVELGIIPHVVDTVIFLKAGALEKVYELAMTVKVPYGMTESDLSRPVIEVKDFESGRPEYEMYSYGEEVVVIPIKQRKGQSAEKPDSAEISVSANHITLYAGGRQGKSVSIMLDGEYLASARADRRGRIKLRKNSQPGRALLDAIEKGKKIQVQ